MKQIALWYVSVFTICLGVASAQTTAKEIESRLQGQVLYLRTPVSGEILDFDASGRPLASYGKSTFTQAGFQATSVHLKKGMLEIKGLRKCLIFDPNGAMKRQSIGNIDLFVHGKEGADFGDALHVILADGLADLVPDMPDFWQPYARSHFLPPTGQPAPAPAVSEIHHPGDEVLMPRVLYQPPLQFPELAKEIGLGGVVLVHLIVEPDGSGSDFSVYMPAGLGLDEKAIDAVKQYKFAPATENGKPIRVDLIVSSIS